MAAIVTALSLSFVSGSPPTYPIVCNLMASSGSGCASPILSSKIALPTGPLSTSVHSSSYLDGLSDEIVCTIMSFLGIPELVALTQTCKRLHSLAGDDTLWRQRCKGKFGQRSLQGWPRITTYKQLYSVLYCIGYLDGLWQSNDEPRGHLVRLYVCPNAVVAHSVTGIQAQDRERNSLSYCFGLRIDSSREDEPWHTNVHLSHACQQRTKNILLGAPLDFGSTAADRTPRSDVVHFRIKRIDDDHFSITYQQTSAPSVAIERMYTRIPDSVYRAPTNSFSGLWSGIYGGHGIEILQFHSNDADNFIRAVKVTGDRNVPSNQVSFSAKNQQPDIVDFRGQRLHRYRGSGMIAQDGFVNPQLIQGAFYCLPGNFSNCWFVWGGTSDIQFSRLVLQDLYDREGNILPFTE